MTNYRSPIVTHQDMMIARSFKNFLLRGTPTIGFVPGYVPIWGWLHGEPCVVDFERFRDDCFLLPVAGNYSLRGILNIIRVSKPIIDFQRPGDDGVTESKPINCLTEAELVGTLKKLSLVIYPDSSSQKWMHFKGGIKYIALKTDQLSAAGRFGRIPLGRLLRKYVGHVLKYGVMDSDLDQQLLDEHRLSTEVVESFFSAAMKLKSELVHISDKARRTELKKEMTQAIDMYSESRQNGR